MRSVFTLVKYNPKLMADLKILTPLEKYLIYELSNPDVGTSFGDDWVRRIIPENNTTANKEIRRFYSGLCRCGD